MRNPIAGAFAALLLCAVPPMARAETETLFDGRTSGLWDTRRDAARVASELSLSEVGLDRQAGELRWRFITRALTFNDLFLMRPITRRFTRLRFRLRNDGAALTFACKLCAADGAEWTAGRVSMPAASGWRWVEFPFSDFAPASWSHDANGRLDYPVSSLAAIAFDVQPGAANDLRIGRVEVVRPDPPAMSNVRVTIPARLAHGRGYRASVRFTLSKPCSDDGAALVFRQGAGELFRAPIPALAQATRLPAGQPITSQFTVDVPEFARGGGCRAELAVGDARMAGSAGLTRTEVVARRPARSTAAVRLHNGTPTLFINGRPHSGMMYMAYGPSASVFTDFARAGVDLFSFPATPTESGYGLSATTWKAPGVYDYTQLDQRVMMVLRANPNARFFPRLYVHAPSWWSEAHPDDVVRYDPGDGRPVPLIHDGGKPAPSWASEAWRRDTIEGLRRLIAHVEASPWADRCIGYHIASGTTEEWMMWGGNEDQWADYSPANLRRFRQWLETRYVNVEALRLAWGSATVTFATAAIPLRAERARSTMGALRDPALDGRAIDYAAYTSYLVADTITTLASAVKRMAGRTKLVGAFYGYLLQLCGEQRQQNAGHNDLERVLASPDIDFLCSPTSYAFRGLGGEGTSHFMSLHASIRLHGKLWFNENDVRTSISGGAPGEWGRPANVVGDLLQLDKEIGNVMANGAAQWWFDVGANRYDHPAIMARVATHVKAARRALALDRRPADEAAMIVDEGSLAGMTVADPMGAHLLVLRLPEIHRFGAPVGHYLQSDLSRIGDRKLFLFMNTTGPTERDRAAIDSLKRDGHVLVFLWTPGIVRDGRVDEAGMEALTGIRLRLRREPTALSLRLRAGGPLQVADGEVIGPGVRTSPVAFADDPDAQVVGTLPDGSAGLVIRRHAGWTSVFVAAPTLPAALLRQLAAMAGVHTWLDTTDVVWASRGLVSVCVRDAGRRTIRLPKPAAVRDLITGEAISPGGDTFTADFAALQTRAFALTPAQGAR